MKKIYSFIALAAILAAGCAREEFSPAVSEGETFTKITVALQGDSKLSIGELQNGKRKLSWSKNDQIAANGVASDKLVDSLMIDGGASAVFAFKSEITSPVEIVYPSSAYKTADKVELPDNPSSTSPKIVILGKGSSINDPIVLKSAVALLKTQFVLAETDPDTDPILNIEVSSTSQQLRGLFTPDYAEATLSASENADSLKTITQKINKAIGVDDTLSVYTIIPAGSYDLAVKVTDAGGHFMTKSLTGKTFEAGTIYSVPATEFVPTGTEIGVEIDGAEAWNEFARAFNENPEEYSKPVEITGDLDFLGTEMVSLGTDDAAFPMAINGNDHILSNVMDGKVSLIYNLGATGILKNLTVGDDCNFVADYPDPEKLFLCSPLVSKLTGTVLNCENRATITIKGYSEEEIAAGMPAAHNSEGYIGGIAANILSGARIIGCKNSGSITVDDTFKDDADMGISSKRFAIGGIAGYGNGKEFRDCVNTADITVNYFINGCLVGGISGGVTSDYFNCINNGNLSKNNGTSAHNRSEYLAGINAYSWTEGKKYVDCANNGNITASGIFKTTYIGGITAYNTKAPVLQRCSNSGNLIIDGARLCYKNTCIGGLLGYTKYAQELDLSGCSVNGEIALYVPTKASSQASENTAIGGVIGLCGEGATINGNGFSITPNIHINYATSVSKSTVQTKDYLGLGAIIGVNKVVNSGVQGKVIIKDCKVNGGKVQIDDLDTGNSVKFTMNNLGVGGILGISMVCGAEISGCEVNSVVGISPAKRNASGVTNQYLMGVGGIAGVVWGGESSITDCSLKSKSELYANVYQSVDETKLTFSAGGIIGDCADTLATSTMSIKNCSVALSATNLDRALTGGIAGKAVNTTIDNCSVDLGSAAFKNSKSCGGIVGYIVNSTVSNCSVLAKAASAIYCNYTSAAHMFGGGIAARANNTAFTNCKSFANIFANKGADSNNPRFAASAVGAFVAKAENGCTFTNCSCGGTLTENVDKDGNVGLIYGGTKTGTKTVTIDKDNVNTYAIMAGDLDNAYVPGTITFTYWNGAE